MASLTHVSICRIDGVRTAYTHVRDVPNSDTFRKLLKTHFFSRAFNVH